MNTKDSPNGLAAALDQLDLKALLVLQGLIVQQSLKLLLNGQSALDGIAGLPVTAPKTSTSILLPNKQF